MEKVCQGYNYRIDEKVQQIKDLKDTIVNLERKLERKNNASPGGSDSGQSRTSRPGSTEKAPAGWSPRVKGLAKNAKEKLLQQQLHKVEGLLRESDEAFKASSSELETANEELDRLNKLLEASGDDRLKELIRQTESKQERFDAAEARFHAALLASTTELEREKQINREYAHFEAVVAKAQITEDQLTQSKGEIQKLREERKQQREEVHKLRKEALKVKKATLKDKEATKKAFGKATSLLKAAVEEAHKELEMAHAVIEVCTLP